MRRVGPEHGHEQSMETAPRRAASRVGATHKAPRRPAAAAGDDRTHRPVGGPTLATAATADETVLAMRADARVSPYL